MSSSLRKKLNKRVWNNRKPEGWRDGSAGWSLYCSFRRSVTNAHMGQLPTTCNSSSWRIQYHLLVFTVTAHTRMHAHTHARTLDQLINLKKRGREKKQDVSLTAFFLKSKASKFYKVIALYIMVIYKILSQECFGATVSHCQASDRVIYPTLKK